jgi:WD40 repeat protein
VWDITTGERVVTIGDQFDSVLAADISPDRQWIALGGPDRVLKIYRTQDGSLEHRIKKHTEWVTAVEFSPDGKYLATGDRNGGLMLWEASTGNELFALNGHKAAITAITWRGDSEMVLSASEDGTMKLWKAADGSSLRSINGHSGGVLAARFGQDGRIVSCGRDNKVQIWETTGKNVKAMAFTGDLPTRVNFSDDGKKVIGSDWKGRVFVWDAVTGKALGELEANPPTLGERVKQWSDKVAAARKEFEGAGSAETKAPEAKMSELKEKLAKAEAALAKWTAAQRDAQAVSTAGKVSVR